MTRKQRSEWCDCWLWRWERDKRQGMSAAFRNWNKQRADSFLRPPEETQSADALTLAQWISWPPELLDNKSVWFYATKFVAICYSSSRKLIQLPLLKGKSELLCRTFRGLMLSSPRLTAWLAYAHPTPMPPSPFFTDWIASRSSTAIPFLMSVPLPGTPSPHLFVWQTPHPLCLSYYKTIPPLWGLSYFPKGTWDSFPVSHASAVFHVHSR